MFTVHRLFIAVLLVCTAQLAAPVNSEVQAEPGDPRPLCKVCRRFWDTSPGQIQFTLSWGRIVKKFQVCSLFDYCELMEKYPDKEPDIAQVVNYATFHDEMVLQVNLTRATFLMTEQGDEEYMQPPFILGFATLDQAKQAQEELGGEILGYKEAMERYTKLAAEFEPEPHYTPSRLRKR